MNSDLQEPGKVRYIAVSGRIDDVAGKDESTVLYFVHCTTIYQSLHRIPRALQDFEL
jgi:hypothetical protein